MTFKINIDYKRKEPTSEEEKAVYLSNSDLTKDYIVFAARQKYPKGADNLKLRNFARIQRKIDDAIFDKKNSINIENAEIEFLKDIFKDNTFPTEIAKYIVILMDEIENLKTDEDIAKEAKKK